MAQLTKNRDPNKNTINGIRGQKIKESKGLIKEITMGYCIKQIDKEFYIKAQTLYD